MKAALYIRVSSAEQAEEGYSLPAQELRLRTYCSEKGYEVSGLYADEGISAKDMRHRPGLLSLMENAQKGNFEIVLVWKLTRFSRNLKDLVTACAELQRHEVYLESITEAFDARTSSGRLILGILGSIAQWEREVIGENTKMGMAERARQGHKTCSYILGYDPAPSGGMTVNRKEAEIVRYIYQSYLQYQSVTKVADLCQKRDYVGKRGKLLSVSAVHKILTRCTYCGYYSHGGNPVKPAPGESFPAIINVQEYNRVQRLLEDSPNSGRRRKHPLVMLPEK